MFAVVLDRPYYPSIDVFPTLEAAQAHANKLLESESNIKGEHNSHLYITQVIRTLELKTDH